MSGSRLSPAAVIRSGAILMVLTLGAAFVLSSFWEAYSLDPRLKPSLPNPDIVTVSADRPSYPPLGRVILTGHVSIPGAVVNVGIKDSNDTAIWIGQAVTDSNGTYTVKLRLKRDSLPGTYTIYATVGERQFISNFTVGVQPPRIESSISLSVNPARTALGNAVELAGSVNPPLGARVDVYVSRGSSGWDLYKSVDSDPNGTFSLLWRPDAEGDYFLKASWHGDDQLEGASSPPQSVSVIGNPLTVSNPITEIPLLYLTILAALALLVGAAILATRFRIVLVRKPQ